MNAKLEISQIFGPTFQGEGSAAGRHCLFVRVFKCNLECGWCDTGYTWAVTEAKAAKTRSGHLYDKNDPAYGLKEMSPEEVIDELLKLWDIKNRPTIIVVTGGEPMMQQERLIPLIEQLWRWGCEVHIETAGTITPIPGFDQYVAQYNVSPKLTSSGNLQGKRYKPATLDWFARNERAWFKFVVTSDNWRADVQEATSIVESRGMFRHRIMMMPEGESYEANIDVARKMADAVLALGFGLTLREHVYIWPGDKDK
jgi:7-carboxy-7-deazaguanine synthase